MMVRSPHLQAMGIQQWVRRELPQQELPPSVTERSTAELSTAELSTAELSTAEFSTADLSTTELSVAEVDFATQVTLQGAIGAPLMLITLPLDPAAEQLLAAMLRAIGVESNHCYRLTVEQPTLLSDSGFLSFLQQQIGDSGSLAQLQLGGETALSEALFHCAHPAHLLTHPEEKRGAWEALKRLHRQLN